MMILVIGDHDGGFEDDAGTDDYHGHMIDVDFRWWYDYDDYDSDRDDGNEAAMGTIMKSTLLRLSQSISLIPTKIIQLLPIKAQIQVKSYFLSTFAVASSMKSTFFFKSNALAKQSSCLWPTLKFDPPSATCEARPCGRSAM